MKVTGQSLEKKIFMLPFASSTIPEEEIPDEIDEQTIKRAISIRAQTKAPKQKFLDIGFAEGFGSRQGDTIGIDPASTPRDLVLTNPEFTPIVAEAENLPFKDNSIENIISENALEFTFIDQALEEILRVLKPGGTVHIKTIINDLSQIQEIKRILKNSPTGRAKIRPIIPNKNSEIARMNLNTLREIRETGSSDDSVPVIITFTKR
jgi:ubiquinone/menaquinone biosynthesis C-methylase UbiE